MAQFLKGGSSRAATARFRVRAAWRMARRRLRPVSEALIVDDAYWVDLPDTVVHTHGPSLRRQIASGGPPLAPMRRAAP